MDVNHQATTEIGLLSFRGLCSLEVQHLSLVAAFEGEAYRALLLQRIHNILTEEFPSSTIEFAALDPAFYIWFNETAALVEAQLRKALARLSNEAIVSFCCGLLYDDAPIKRQDALLKATLARSAARKAGLDYLFYDQISLDFEAGLRGWAGLSQAMAENRILLCAQEIRSSSPKGLVRQFEVLIVVMDAKGRALPLEQLLSHVERHGGIAKLDRWLLRRVIIGYGAALAQNPHISLSLNVSGQTITRRGFCSFLLGLLQESGVAAKQLQIEITETSQIHDIEIARENVTALREAGIDVAIDDFGAAFSGPFYLARLPVNVVKIDGALVSLLSAPSEVLRVTTIMRSMVAMCHDLGVSLVAEYVESPEIADFLRDLGVDKLQGFALARPIPLNVVFA